MQPASCDNHQNTVDFGTAAWQLICNGRTSADPFAYAVWYAFARRTHPALVAALERRLLNGTPSDEELADLHAKYLAGGPMAGGSPPPDAGPALQAISDGAGRELQDVLTTLQRSRTSLGACGTDLHDALGQMAGPRPFDAALQATLEAVLTTTQRIADTNRSLESRLQQSEGRISGLRADLDAARLATFTDGLTSLLNRRAFDEQLSAAVRAGGPEPLALAMIDIDHFKSFNDTHGHPVGDQVIRLVASCLKQDFPPFAAVARFGGEEFAVILPGLALEPAASLTEQVRERIGRYDIVQQGTRRSLGRVTISAGVAAFRSGDVAETLLARADEQLYVAKRSGRDRVAAVP